MELTSFLAVWGALLSTVAVTWNVLRDMGDRGRIKVDAMIGKKMPDHADRDYLIVTMTNIGRRPVLVKSYGLLLKEKPRAVFIVPRELPRMLSEGDYHMEFTHDLTYLTPEVAAIYVLDSAGRYWKAPKKATRAAIKRAQELAKS